MTTSDKPIIHSPAMLDDIERTTIAHYQGRAQLYWQGTRDHDVSQNISAFLAALPDDQTLDILDLGCGPGRDLITFKSLGHRATGLDGTAAFCLMARKNSDCPVLHQHFLQLDLASNKFDGIFANASLFHVPSQELPSVLANCYRALRPQGVLFMSNPRGDAEGWQGDRYGNCMEIEQSQILLQQAGFTLLDHYYRPGGKPRDQQPWLAIVAQRQD